MIRLVSCSVLCATLALGTSARAAEIDYIVQANNTAYSQTSAAQPSAGSVFFRWPAIYAKRRGF